MTSTMSDNPFPLEAVATYGRLGHHYENLAYVDQATNELQSYLIAYPRTDLRYGGAIGLQGGHGSGKTHVLNAIKAKADLYQTQRPIVLYGKADRSSFFDLYSQLIADLTRARVQELIGQALQQTAIETVSAASVTEKISERIHDPKDLPQL